MNCWPLGKTEGKAHCLPARWGRSRGCQGPFQGKTAGLLPVSTTQFDISSLPAGGTIPAPKCPRASGALAGGGDAHLRAQNWDYQGEAPGRIGTVFPSGPWPCGGSIGRFCWGGYSVQPWCRAVGLGRLAFPLQAGGALWGGRLGKARGRATRPRHPCEFPVHPSPREREGARGGPLDSLVATQPCPPSSSELGVQSRPNEIRSH